MHSALLNIANKSQVHSVGSGGLKMTKLELCVVVFSRLLKKQFYHRALKVMKKKPEKEIKKEKEKEKEKDKAKCDSSKEDEKKGKKEKEKKKDSDCADGKKEKNVRYQSLITALH